MDGAGVGAVVGVVWLPEQCAWDSSWSGNNGACLQTSCACVLYDAPVVQQWLAQQCVCTQQQLEQQQWVLPVR